MSSDKAWRVSGDDFDLWVYADNAQQVVNMWWSDINKILLIERDQYYDAPDIGKTDKLGRRLLKL